jgi:hypothetical protein
MHVEKRATKSFGVQPWKKEDQEQAWGLRSRQGCQLCQQFNHRLAWSLGSQKAGLAAPAAAEKQLSNMHLPWAASKIPFRQHSSLQPVVLAPNPCSLKLHPLLVPNIFPCRIRTCLRINLCIFHSYLARTTSISPLRRHRPTCPVSRFIRLPNNLVTYRWWPTLSAMQQTISTRRTATGRKQRDATFRYTGEEQPE